MVPLGIAICRTFNKCYCTLHKLMQQSSQAWGILTELRVPIIVHDRFGPNCECLPTCICHLFFDPNIFMEYRNPPASIVNFFTRVLMSHRLTVLNAGLKLNPKLSVSFHEVKLLQFLKRIGHHERFRMTLIQIRYFPLSLFITLFPGC